MEPQESTTYLRQEAADRWLSGLPPGEAAMPKQLHLETASDPVERVARASALDAVEELIWNGLDADTKLVGVVLERQALGGLEKVRVFDRGHGIAYDEVEDLFGKFGGSLKKFRDRTPAGRRYHGKDGQGRYKSLAIGARVVWTSTFLPYQDAAPQRFTITLEKERPTVAVVSDPEPCAPDTPTGVEVEVSVLLRAADTLLGSDAGASLLVRLAPYLLAYPGITIEYDSRTLNPLDAIQVNELYPIRIPATEEAAEICADLRVLEWSQGSYKRLFLCNPQGFALRETPPGISAPGFSFSAYVLSTYIEDQYHNGMLELGALDPGLAALEKEAHRQLRAHFRSRTAVLAQEKVRQMKDQGVYPYEGEPKGSVEVVEREVFDICAATVHQYLPTMSTGAKDSQRLTFRLLREALESNPRSLDLIFREVLKLPQEQQDDLADLLEKTTLPGIINTAKTVADRLDFLHGLETILFDKDIRKCLRERSQLHKIIVNELWIFGDEYTLGTSDQSLRNVLKEHLKILGISELAKDIPADQLKGLDDIPDLWLWRTRSLGSPDELAHLVVELKRPTCKISFEEIMQGIKYATTVAENRAFSHAGNKWEFIVVSDDIHANAMSLVKQQDRKFGHVHRGANEDVWVMTWSQILQKAKGRLAFLRDQLEYTLDENNRGLEYLRGKYPKFMPDISEK